jgi:hypothetical protein
LEQLFLIFKNSGEVTSKFYNFKKINIKKMSHVLAKLKGVKFKDIEAVLKEDAPKHAEKGLYLEHIWQNVDNPHEIAFLFKADDLKIAKQYIESEHENALKQNPNANLPKMIFLE